jgi:LPLT family lysophospholipid transporter-like MFS transporter
MTSQAHPPTTFHFSNSFFALMLAQFVSALADNAMLLLCIALMIEQGQAAWWIPLIKAFFTLSYVLLAPWVGVMADRWPKPTIMRVANAIKAVGCLAVMLALPVPLAYALIGLGAALYAPAKYGWITEVVPANGLVRANGWIEVSTVGAAIMGVTLGGVMLSGVMLSGGWFDATGLSSLTDVIPLESSHGSALVVMLCLYVVPIVLTHWVQRSHANYPAQSLKVRDAVVLFMADQWQLWSDASARVSLAVTTLFWGLGAVIQLLVLQWAQEQLKVSLDQAAYLQGCTGLGVIVGAWLAGRWVPLAHATRVLWVGVVLGIAMPLLIAIETLPLAVLTMLLVGMLSGFFVVPMNALLQHRGVQLLTAGRSIAVQNFNENASILMQTGAYALLIYADASLSAMLVCFGVATAGLMLVVMWHHQCIVKTEAAKAASLAASSAQ